MLSDHVLRTDMVELIRRLPDGHLGFWTFGPALTSADDREIQSFKIFPASVQGLIGRIMVAISQWQNSSGPHSHLRQSGKTVGSRLPLQGAERLLLDPVRCSMARH